MFGLFGIPYSSWIQNFCRAVFILFFLVVYRSKLGCSVYFYWECVRCGTSEAGGLVPYEAERERQRWGKCGMRAHAISTLASSALIGPFSPASDKLGLSFLANVKVTIRAKKLLLFSGEKNILIKIYEEIWFRRVIWEKMACFHPGNLRENMRELDKGKKQIYFEQLNRLKMWLLG